MRKPQTRWLLGKERTECSTITWHFPVTRFRCHSHSQVIKLWDNSTSYSSYFEVYTQLYKSSKAETEWEFISAIKLLQISWKLLKEIEIFINTLTNPMVSLLEYIFLKSVKFILADNIKKSSEEIKLWSKLV